MDRVCLADLVEELPHLPLRKRAVSGLQRMLRCRPTLVGCREGGGRAVGLRGRARLCGLGLSREFASRGRTGDRTLRVDREALASFELHLRARRGDRLDPPRFDADASARIRDRTSGRYRSYGSRLSVSRSSRLSRGNRLVNVANGVVIALARAATIFARPYSRRMPPFPSGTARAGPSTTARRSATPSSGVSEIERASESLAPDGRSIPPVFSSVMSFAIEPIVDRQSRQGCVMTACPRVLGGGTARGAVARSASDAIVADDAGTAALRASGALSPWCSDASVTAAIATTAARPGTSRNGTGRAALSSRARVKDRAARRLRARAHAGLSATASDQPRFPMERARRRAEHNAHCAACPRTTSLSRTWQVLERQMRLVRLRLRLQGWQVLEQPLRRLRLGLRLQGRPLLERALQQRALSAL